VSELQTRRRAFLAGGALLVGVVGAAATWSGWPLSPAYVASAAALGAATGLLTRRMSPGWSSFVSVLAIVVVLDEVSERFYPGAVPWGAGMFQAVVVGVATFALFEVLADLVLDRIHPAAGPIAAADDVP